MEAQQSVLSPAGADAQSIATLSWIMFCAAALIFFGVVLITIFAHKGNEAWRRRLSSNAFIFCVGIIFPTVTLVALLIYGLMLTGARVMATEADALHIEVVGEQWWWRVRYTESGAVTANEIRVPVGRQVEIKLTSADVIHSFWAPNLAGKVDMIPGVVNVIRLRATKTGTYRGQCAEYCGGPHALMAFHVIALEPAQFEEWLAEQQRPARSPTGALQIEGESRFISKGCNACHTIRGTAANGAIGPDLTHVGGRISLAAATLPNDVRSFGRWIRDNQHIKPNNRMPPFGVLTDRELAALAAYLEGLQ